MIELLQQQIDYPLLMPQEFIVMMSEDILNEGVG